MGNRPTQKPGSGRSRATWIEQWNTNARPITRMAAFAVVFVITVVGGLILGSGPSVLAIASITGGVASIAVDWGWRQRTGSR